jgi:hypothetical protein
MTRTLGYVLTYGKLDRNGQPYGEVQFLTSTGPSRAFLHARHIEKRTRVTEGAVVSMEVVSRDRGYEARDVRDVSDEADLAVIEQGLWQSHSVVPRVARSIFVERAPAADAAHMLRELLRRAGDAEVKSLLERRPLLAEGELLALVEWDVLAYAAEGLPAEEAAHRLGEWLRCNDERLGGPRGPRADLSMLRRDILEAFAADYAALLPWPVLRDRIEEFGPAGTARCINDRRNYGLEIQVADIPEDVLACDLKLARNLGWRTFVRGLQRACQLVNDRPEWAPILSDIVSSVNSQWLSSGRSSQQLFELSGALRFVDLAPLLESDLDSAVKVERAWSSLISDFESTWQMLGWRERVLTFFRSVATDARLPYPPVFAEAHQLALAAQLIAANPGDGRVARQADEAIKSYVIDLGWLVESPPDLSPLLPSCTEQRAAVRYCEGRHWPSAEDMAWCPRLRAPCLPSVARIRPDLGRPWWAWSLLELLDASVTRAQVPGADPDEWVNKLSGWLNRWDDVRNRLRCRGCGRVMDPNYRYALQFDAAYATTVMRCEGPPNHDGEVYLSHCRRCARLIDSRDCSVKDDGYLCTKCGAGARYTEPGDRCPHCGRVGMKQRLGTASWDCPDCGHRIHDSRGR